jgi:Tfp pilus assembly protein PilW
MFTTSCSTSWVNVAIQDLPVLIQIATSIISLLPMGSSSADMAAVAKISTNAQNDLTLIQALTNDYKTTPSSSTLAKIEAAIADAQTNLPAELAALHISDTAKVMQITAAVNIVLTTITAIASLLPPSTGAATMKVSAAKVVVPNPKQLKLAWSQQVCSGDATCTALVK